MRPPIEERIIQYLTECGWPAYAERPPNPPKKYVIIDRINGEIKNCMGTAQIAVQSIAPTLDEALTINEAVIEDMLAFTERNDIAKSKLDNCYNYSNAADHTYKYQAVFELVYYR